MDRQRKSKSRKRSRRRNPISRELPVGEGRFLGKVIVAIVVIIFLATMAYIIKILKFPTP
jgi:hypothetical protein